MCSTGGENYLLKGEKEKMKIEEKGKEWISVELSSSPPERKDLLFRWGSLIRVYNLSRSIPEGLGGFASPPLGKPSRTKGAVFFKHCSRGEGGGG